jgi:hypothetical protein
MFSIESTEALRMLERIIVVSGGVLSIVLGYRLFMIADLKNDGAGEFKSKVLSVRLTKLYPGVFFALFGAIVMGISLWKPIQISNPASASKQLPPTAALAELTKLLETLPEKDRDRARQLIFDIAASNQIFFGWSPSQNSTGGGYGWVPGEPRRGG